MNENEPLMKCRENAQSVKTHCILVTGDKCSGNLNYRLCGPEYSGSWRRHEFYSGLFMEHLPAETAVQAGGKPYKDAKGKAQAG